MINELDSIELLLLNVILQATVLSCLALVVSVFLRNRAAKLYSLLYPAQVSLLILVLVSVILQFGGNSLFLVEIGFFENSPALQSIPAEAVKKIATGMNSGAFSIRPESTYPDAPGSRYEIGLLLVTLWLSGSMLFLLRLGFGLNRVRHLVSLAEPLTQQQSQKLHDSIDVDSLRRLRVRQHPDVLSPVLVGIKSPVLLLPMGLIENLTSEELKSILIHELAHFDRGDFMSNLVQQLAVAAFWFHPLVHYMDRIVCRAREEICDNHVLQQTDAVDYGETLLRVNSFMQSRLSRPAQAVSGSWIEMGMFGKNWNLEQRIAELLSNSREATMQLKPIIEHTVQTVVVAVAVSLGASHVGAVQADADSVQDAIDDAQREQTEQLTSELDAQAQQLDRASVELDRQMQEMQSRATAMREELDLRAEQQARQLDSQSQELESETRLLNQVQEELQREIQNMQLQHREIEQQLQLERQRLQQELIEVRETLRQELSQQNISVEIDNAISELRQSLSELDEQDLSVASSSLGLDVNELTRTAIVAALKSLEDLDVEALERQIIEQVELSLLDFDLEEMDVDIDMEHEIDIELTRPPVPAQSAAPL